MNNKSNTKLIALVIIGLLVFTFVYYIILDKTNYKIISDEEYKNNPECEFKKLDDGYIQITNCMKYKYNP
ncbi:unnamed protein product [marine sediment metagenome]|uniref:Uncharacterized protein n=1 Tax=marine sediment metagenome TaxID=412755 RepID=X1B7C3_9ZZZZ